MELFKKKKIIVTHDGTFHADDLFACATLSIWFKSKGQPFKIVRTRDPATIEKADIVVDVGGEYVPERNRYDHHQREGGGSRENGVPYASFGLVWKHFGLDLCGGDHEAWRSIDTQIASSLDAIDNGVDVCTPKFEGIMPYSGQRPFLIFSPTWKESDLSINDIFWDQVNAVEKVLEREIEVAVADSSGKAMILEAYNRAEDKRIVEVPVSFPRYLYQGVLSELPEPIYIIYKSEHATIWKVEAISKPNTLESRKLFPESWRGFMTDDPKLIEATGVPGAMFCHRSGFLITARSLAAAQSLAQKALLA